MTTIGCVLPPYGNPPSRFAPFARTAEAAGLDEVWLWEDCFLESGPATAAAMLAATERLRVGIGVMPAPLRHVALTAMETATLDGMFPGRFLPGLGHGVQSWMGQLGVRAASPLTLLREQVGALRALLDGERVTTSGRYVTLDDVALDWPPASAPPVLCAAKGPRTLRLVGEVADGVVFDGGAGLAAVRRALPLLDEGRAAAGRPPVRDSGPGSEDPFRVVTFLPVAAGPDAVERVRRAAATEGLDPQDGAVLADHFSWGSAEQVADGLRRFVDLGATSVVAEPTRDEPDLDGFATFVGERVAPLLL
ncbi:LLM class flavin-dependent oxidoreductase [Isoptericola sp. NEAU-Y5]|uniref:LLM class flavin-dependent oxidoreductase n=1 Tax=Isoptericola luteus TaxID=2879484 RepID=A0ABS7ZE17_9MICO|nr:LLM class flavin-dependent oxidoreductase [Isoptericola sp. NEAU-Y5]MCA5892069.1 LLM class flavin-dependent oxidoreductase [Isoptericola sp. NEAU-Y5]